MCSMQMLNQELGDKELSDMHLVNLLYMPKGVLEGGRSFEQKAGISKSCLTMQAAALLLNLWLLKESDIIASCIHTCASSPPLERTV